MRKRLKLSFDLLEDTLTLISPLEAAYVLEGNGDGSGWDPSSNFNDSGSDNPFASGIAAMLERFLQDRETGSGAGYDESDGSDGSVDTYDGPWGGTTPNPGGGGDNSNTGDPWKRVNGELVAERTGNTTEVNYGENAYTIYFDEVKFETVDGDDIIALEVTAVKNNANNQMLSVIPDEFKSNCSGYAFLDGKYWLVDSYESTNVNEVQKFEDLLNDNSVFKEEFNSVAADFAVIWWTDKQTGERFIAHSAKVNGINSYSQKSDYNQVQSNVSFSEFTNGHIPDPELYSYEVAYYRNNVN